MSQQRAAADSALLANTKLARSAEGGINLNPDLGFVTIRRDTNGKALPMSLQPIQNIDIKGLKPTLLSIVPFTPQLLEK